MYIRTILFIITGLASLSVKAQSLQTFRTDFRRFVEQSTVSDSAIRRFYEENHEILSPYFNISNNSIGENLSNYPLASFKEDTLYVNNISRLVYADNPWRRSIGYAMLAAANDHSYDAYLKKQLPQEQNDVSQLTLVCSVLYLKIPATNDAFRVLTLPKHQAAFLYILPMLLQQPLDSLRRTAFSHINSHEQAEKIYALQLLRFTPSNKEVETVLWNAFNRWENAEKTIVLHVIADRKISAIGEYVKPLLEDNKTKSSALQALVASTFTADRQLLTDYINRQTVLDRDLVTALLYSPGSENNRLLLRLLTERKVEAEPGSFFVYQMFPEYFRRDELLADVQLALETVTDAGVLNQLVRLLENRTDRRSTAICLNLLKHTDNSVRRSAAMALYGNRTPELKAMVPVLLNDPALRTVQLTRLTIENKVDNLHPVFDRLYNEYLGWDWKESALTYYNAFPKARYVTVYRKELHSQHELLRMKAAIGLGLLHDKASVNDLIAVCRNESADKQYLIQCYLSVLARFKSENVRAFIETYAASTDKTTADLAMSLLKQW